MGGEIADLIVVIRSLEAMKAFCGRYHLALGASFSATAGLMGRTMEADVRAAPSGFSACYTYCCSKGMHESWGKGGEERRGVDRGDG